MRSSVQPKLTFFFQTKPGLLNHLETILPQGSLTSGKAMVSFGPVMAMRALKQPAHPK